MMNYRPKPIRVQRPGTITNLHNIEDYIPVPKTKKSQEAAAKARELKVVEAWRQIAPAEVLEHSDNIYLFKEGQRTRLVVYVDSGIWAAELGTQKYRIQQKMQAALGTSIDTVDIYPSSLGHKKRMFEKRWETPETVQETASVPLTPEEFSHIEEGLENITSEKLKNALLKARIKDTEWKKGLNAEKSR